MLIKKKLAEWGWLCVTVMNRTDLQTYPQQWVTLSLFFIN